MILDNQEDPEVLLANAIRDLISGKIKCSDDIPKNKRPKSASARRAFGAVYHLLNEMKSK